MREDPSVEFTNTLLIYVMDGTKFEGGVRETAGLADIYKSKNKQTQRPSVTIQKICLPPLLRVMQREAVG